MEIKMAWQILLFIWSRRYFYFHQFAPKSEIYNVQAKLFTNLPFYVGIYCLQIDWPTKIVKKIISKNKYVCINVKKSNWNPSAFHQYKYVANHALCSRKFDPRKSASGNFLTFCMSDSVMVCVKHISKNKSVCSQLGTDYLHQMYALKKNNWRHLFSTSPNNNFTVES